MLLNEVVLFARVGGQVEELGVQFRTAGGGHAIEGLGGFAFDELPRALADGEHAIGAMGDEGVADGSLGRFP